MQPLPPAAHPAVFQQPLVGKGWHRGHQQRLELKVFLGAVRGNAKTLVRALWRSDGKQLLGVWNLLLLNQQPEPFPVPKSARAVENCIGNVTWSSPKVCLSSLGTLGAPAQTGAVVCGSQECPHPHMCGVGVCAAEQRLPTTQQERWYFSRLAALEIPSPLFPLPWAGWLILGAPR